MAFPSNPKEISARLFEEAQRLEAVARACDLDARCSGSEGEEAAEKASDCRLVAGILSDAARSTTMALSVAKLMRAGLAAKAHANGEAA